MKVLIETLLLQRIRNERKIIYFSMQYRVLLLLALLLMTCGMYNVDVINFETMGLYLQQLNHNNISKVENKAFGMLEYTFVLFFLSGFHDTHSQYSSYLIRP